MMPRMDRKRWWIAGGALLLGIMLLRQVFTDGDDDNARPAVLVRTAPVQRQDVPLKLSAVGTVVSYQSVAVRSRLDSQVMEVKFRDGDYVNEGDLLFVLDDRTLKAQLNEQMANLKRDKAQLLNAKQQYERSLELSKKGFAPRASLDDAKAAYEVQKAAVGATEAAVENLKVQMEYTRIVAPISGRTGTINITVGNNVKATDQSLVTLNQVKPIRVQVALPQRYLDTVRSALMQQSRVQVQATREGNTEPSAGVLEYINNEVDQNTGTFAARAEFPNENEALWPGMFVTLSLVLGEEKQVLTIPEVAVQQGQESDFVFVAAGGKAVKRGIKLARIQDGAAIVEEGVKDGERVVVDGLMSLHDGSDIAEQTAGEKP